MTHTNIPKDELKSCPFCNKTHLVCLFDDIGTFGMGTDYYLACQICFSQGPMKKSKDKAKEAWNHRKGQNSEEYKDGR